jgi:hypothetical protein
MSLWPTVSDVRPTLIALHEPLLTGTGPLMAIMEADPGGLAGVSSSAMGEAL